MSIRLLSPQLANQIAAGEVVERPASVLKELVENSIDAGATQIDIDVEQGGSRLLKVHDNGMGIAKAELSLALARHATSKIEHLEDLIAIQSLGFRGEALASISSVSRLTLTSRTAEQTEAWQVHAEGREMQTTLTPAAHPIGSTVEVGDLFYNTPARRRFLKTDKTEFAHIDDTLKKMALSYPGIGFQLAHNGKRIRHYRAANTDTEMMRRLTAICGTEFVSGALKLDWRHDDFYIHGWINPTLDKDIHYFYVNHRVVRDKLLTHAIKQAFEPMNISMVPAYVLYFELNPADVDVNVHPTKQEVRFHESRLVHDFVFQALRMSITTTAENQKESYAVPNVGNRAAAGENTFLSSCPTPVPVRQETGGFSISSRRGASPTPEVLTQYHDLMDPPRHRNNDALTATLFPPPTALFSKPSSGGRSQSLGKVLTLWRDKYAILQHNTHLQLVSLEKAEQILYSCRLQEKTAKSAEKLLIPLKLAITAEEKQCWNNHHAVFSDINVVYKVERNTLQLQAVPALLRMLNWQQVMSELTTYLMALSRDTVLTVSQASTWLIERYCQWVHLTHRRSCWTQVQAVALMTQLEQITLTSVERRCFLENIDLDSPLTQLESK